MTVRIRAWYAELALGVVVLLALVALTALVAEGGNGLTRLDERFGAAPQAFTAAHDGLTSFLLVVQSIFATVPMAVVTAIAAVLLWTRGHHRAAGWTVVVMLGSSVTTTVMKSLVDRDRPVFADAIEELASKSFPSGHASGIASAAGVATVLTLMLVRRRGLRRGLVAVYVAVALLVGADRILLGVHNLSDVVGGYAVGLVWVLFGLLVYDPAPRSLASPSAADTAPESRRQLAVVLNPIKVESVDGFHTIVDDAARRGGWSEPRWYETTVEDPGTSMAEQAALDGAELVIVCGGDGTVRTVCAELAGTGVPVGIVPAGTGNLLARNLDLPLYLPAAVDVALHGHDRAIDLVKVAGDGIEADAHFLVMAGMGFDAQIMEGVNEKVKAKVGWLAYVVSALRSLMFPAVRLEISLDGGEFTRHRARTVVVGNVGQLQAGMPLIPDAAIDDGQLDVVLINPRVFLSWLRVAFRVLTKGKRTDATVNRFTCRTVVVKASSDTPRQLDGDSIGPGRRLCAEVVHGRLLVRGPR